MVLHYCCHLDSRLQNLSDEIGTLQELYISTNGSRWRRNRHWGSSSQMNLWEGVTVDDKTQLSELVLAENNLSGENINATSIYYVYTLSRVLNVSFCNSGAIPCFVFDPIFSSIVTVKPFYLFSKEKFLSVWAS